jgi:hypothetical protein
VAVQALQVLKFWPLGIPASALLATLGSFARWYRIDFYHERSYRSRRSLFTVRPFQTRCSPPMKSRPVFVRSF